MDTQTPKQPVREFGDYLRTSQMSAYTGIASSTWAKRRLSGNTPAYIKCGKVILYRRNDVDEWMQKNLRASTSDNGGEHAA